MMVAHRRLLIAVMAGEPAPDGGTRFAHLEAIPVRHFRALRLLFDRLVEGDIRSFRRSVGT